MLDPKTFLKNSQIVVSPQTYVIVKAKAADFRAFANIIHENETTVIIEQSKLDPEGVIEMESDWRLLSFRVVLPCELVGFLALVAEAIAKAHISIFAISAFSTDHILVKNRDLPKCKEALTALGCEFIY